MFDLLFSLLWWPLLSFILRRFLLLLLRALGFLLRFYRGSLLSLLLLLLMLLLMSFLIRFFQAPQTYVADNIHKLRLNFFWFARSNFNSFQFFRNNSLLVQ